jgi:hypothetical protein
LTDIDLTDPSPPVPGDAQRAAVHARAGQLVRRRRMLQGAGALAAMLVLVVGVVAIAGGGSGGDAPVASIRVRPVSLVQDATVTLQLRNDDGTFEGTADANGTVDFGRDIPPGTYRVFVTIESAEGDSGNPAVDIGTAVQSYEPFPMTLEAGTNTINLDELTPVGTPTTPEAPTTATR